MAMQADSMNRQIKFLLVVMFLLSHSASQTYAQPISFDFSGTDQQVNMTLINPYTGDVITVNEEKNVSAKTRSSTTWSSSIRVHSNTLSESFFQIEQLHSKYRRRSSLRPFQGIAIHPIAKITMDVPIDVICHCMDATVTE